MTQAHCTAISVSDICYIFFNLTQNFPDCCLLNFCIITYLKCHHPTLTGETTSSDTADSSRTLLVIHSRSTHPIGKYLRSSIILRYSATNPALCTKHMAASVWFEQRLCSCCMFCNQARRRSGEFWYLK